MFHKRTFELLHVQPCGYEEAAAALRDVEERHSISLPGSVKEWYGDAHSMPIMSEIRSTFECYPAWLAELGGLFASWHPTYAKTAPIQPMFPLLFEQTGVWHLAAALDGQEDPPVYVGYQRDETFEWHLHSQTFSQFVEAWVWDYLSLTRDYVAFVTPYFNDEDAERVRSAFLRGPVTHHIGGIDNSERCERYYRDDQRISLSFDKQRKLVWFSAESAFSMLSLLNESWGGGPMPDSLKNRGGEKLRWPRR